LGLSTFYPPVRPFAAIRETFTPGVGFIRPLLRASAFFPIRLLMYLPALASVSASVAYLIPSLDRLDGLITRLLFVSSDAPFHGDRSGGGQSLEIIRHLAIGMVVR
jgi:hypothetical protein